MIRVKYTFIIIQEVKTLSRLVTWFSTDLYFSVEGHQISYHQ